MLFEEVYTEDITSSLNGVSSLDGDFDTMRLESDSSDAEFSGASWTHRGSNL